MSATDGRASFDVAIVGGGFTGSLLAYVLSSAGARVVIVDARTHPRFAIGESSTPIADLLLRRIAERFDLPALLPLSRYGAWKRERAELVCGKKRGFSYFAHPVDQPFVEGPAHERSLLVTASPDDERSDTHWMRSDVDHYFWRLAVDAGTRAILGTVVSADRTRGGWSLSIVPTTAGNPCVVSCRFLVDAGGGDRRLQSQLGIVDQADRLLTDTRSTFGHCVGVGSWEEWLAQHGMPVDDHPFSSDDAAQHHLLERGWLWMLRMDDGRTSVGWTRPRATPESTDRSESGGLELPRALGLGRHPSLAQILSRAEVVAPLGGLRSTERLQRLASQVVGENMALMPTAAAVIDPLHSSGIAHGLSGVWHLAEILLESEPGADRNERLEAYQRRVYREAHLMDRLVVGCYWAQQCFPLFTAHAMGYFVAAIQCEEAIAAGNDVGGLWSADDAALSGVVDQSLERIRALVAGGREPSPDAVAEHLEWTRQALSPWNRAGLMDPAANNMYRYTAAPK